MIRFLKKQPPGRLIALGFAAVILIGSALLMLPISIRPGVEVAYIDALFTSTSAVCVTGLIAVDAYDNFTVFGQAVLAGLIQIGGLGVTSVGVGLILAAGRRVSIKGRSLVKEALNVDSFQGMVRLIQWVLKVTLCFEGAGAVLSFLTFSQDYPLPRALWTSVFHSVAAFNNSGFDILGGMQNLIPYQSDVLLNLVTCALIIFGGLGFLVMLDIRRAGSFRKLTFHSKVVITTTAALLAVGTLLLKATEDMTWLGAFFHSVSARTAGFSTYSMGELTNAGLFTLILLMFIGACPGSTGGGIKTTTFTVLAATIVCTIRGKSEAVILRHRFSTPTVYKAFTLTFVSILLVFIDAGVISSLNPDILYIDCLYEATSAFGTVGLSASVTPNLDPISKLILIFTMFVGRVGPLSFGLSILMRHKEKGASIYPEGRMIIG